MTAGNVGLWIIQGVCALAFLAAGGVKTFLPITVVRKNMSWANDAPVLIVRLVGVAEILGAIGLILPAATGILPWLTPLAAAGLLIVLLGAVSVHATRREWNHIGTPVLLLLLVAVVLIGRLTFAPLPVA